MVCQACGQRPATVHIMKTINNHKEEHHLCETCAREQGHVGLEPNFAFPNFSVQNILASLLDQEPLPPVPGSTAPATRCSGCGSTFHQFRERGFFGCGQCYEAFSAELVPLLRRIQGSEKHQGKIPKRTEGRLRTRRELAQLRRELQAAVAGEQYEKAAKLHERIKALEQQAEAGGGVSAVE